MLVLTHTHTPIWLLQLGRKIFPRSAAGIDLTLVKIFQEFETGKIIVKIDMVVLSFQIRGEHLHDPCSKPMLSGVVLPCVDFKPQEVPIGAVCGNPDLDPMLDGFQWHLQKTFPESLIYSDVTGRLISLGELGGQVVNQWSDLPKTIMAILSTQYQCVIVDKVEIPGDLTESVSSYTISHWSVPQTGIS